MMMRRLRGAARARAAGGASRRSASTVAFGGPFPYGVDAGSFQDALDEYLGAGGRTVEVLRGQETLYEALHMVEEPVEVVATARVGVEDPAERAAAVAAALRVPRVDLVLLEVPAGAAGGDVRAAMASAQGAVEAGTAGAFGLDADGFGRDASHPEHVALEPLLEGAPAGLAAVRFPLSLLEAGAVTRRNCAGGSRTAAEAARAAGLRVLATRPLEGRFRDASPQRLQTFPPVDGTRAAARLKEALDIATHVELHYREIHEELTRNGVQLPKLRDVAWGQIVAANLDYLLNAPQWEDAYHKQLRPCLAHVFEAVRPIESLRDWSQQYRVAMDQALRRISEAAQHNSAGHLAELEAAVGEACPPLALAEAGSLEAQALRAVFAAGPDAVFVNPQARARQYGSAGAIPESEVADLGLPPADKRPLLTVAFAAAEQAAAAPPTRDEALALLERTDADFGFHGVLPQNPVQ